MRDEIACHERGSILGGQVDPVPCADSRRDRRVVHREQRDPVRRAGQFGVQPLQAHAVQLAVHLAGARRVEHDEPERTELD
ncbi:MAG: hypothetical protein ACLP0J_29300, partial [Solirubrobacteraceae bacterium]